MKQLIGAIYLSFGFLFYMLNGFENYHASTIYHFVVFGFMFMGVAYLFNDSMDSNRKKNNK